MGLGITNQRETTVVWDPVTGEPYGNAIVWQDTRTDKIAAALDRDGRGDVIRHRAGLPPATYFSGGKLQWIWRTSTACVRPPNEAAPLRHHGQLAVVESDWRR